MRSPMRVLMLVHEDLVPPPTFEGLSEREITEVRTEDDVLVALEESGHEVQVLGLYDRLQPLDEALAGFRPHVVFNLLEEFHGDVRFDAHVAAYLELKRVPYTGCGPRGLSLARDKALAKKIVAFHGVTVPRFQTFALGARKPAELRVALPAIVKCQTLEASTGISQASVVHGEKALRERVAFVHERFEVDAIVEEFVPGREIYSAVLGHHRAQVMPPWELYLDGLPDTAPRIATSRVKWDLRYQEKYRIRAGAARRLSAATTDLIARTSHTIYEELGLDGYARIDYRLDSSGALFFLEANPNPDIAEFEEFSSAARAGGLNYHALLEEMLRLARRRGGRRPSRRASP
ncbi:MAG: D-alanine--D-alanine ligase [Myxococcota bacterium]